MVLTRLAAVKKKKYILPTNANKNNKDNSNNDASIYVVSTEKPTSDRIVPETQAQVVKATQGANVHSTFVVLPRMKYHPSVIRELWQQS